MYPLPLRIVLKRKQTKQEVYDLKSDCSQDAEEASTFYLSSIALIA